MRSLWILGVVSLLSAVDLEAARFVRQISCPIRNLTVTANDHLARLYFDGVEIADLPNADIYSQPDVATFSCTTRLIAIHVRNGQPGPGVAGFLASTDDDFVLTNSTWKCSNVSQLGWEEIGFDDSTWMSAVEYGNNGEGVWGLIPGISTNAQWIWLRQWNGQMNSSSEDMDAEVYCRKRLVIDYCVSDPCVNGGSCETLVNGYVCHCPLGYTGDQCEDVINYCMSDPCLHGGSCFPGIGGYLCVCDPWYTGDRCEIQITTPCVSFPCLNGGTCYFLFGSYFTCTCTPNFTGTLCESQISFPCDSFPCLNGGTCNNLGGSSFTCTCPSYTTGIICESSQFNSADKANYSKLTNFNESMACGILEWSGYPASNGFTILCYFSPSLTDLVGNATECRDTIQRIPLYKDYVGLLNAGGNFGCLISQNYPDDLPATSFIACAENYQHNISLVDLDDSAILMVCLRYP